MIAAGNHDWLEATRYAAALQSSDPLPVVDDLPVHLAPNESATMRTIATYERLRPVRSTDEWTERHGAAVIATTDRLLVDHRLRGWTSFWFDDIAILEPRLTQEPWQVDLSWLHDEPPLRLSGPTAPLITVHVAAYLDWARWTQRTDLQPLLKPRRGAD